MSLVAPLLVIRRATTKAPADRHAVISASVYSDYAAVSLSVLGKLTVAGNVCPGGEVPLRYIEVDASRSLDLIFDLSFVPDPFTIQGHAELRLR